MANQYNGEIGGSSKRGDLNMTYAEIVEAWGEPHITYNAGGDSRVEWRWADDEGNFATVYDYGRMDTPLDEVVWWSIGGNSYEAVWIVRDIIPDHTRAHGRGGNPFMQSVV